MIEEMLQKQNLAQLRAVVEKLAARIEAPENVLPTYGASEDSARPHIEIDGRYHFVVVERGLELERRTTTDLDEILYWIFDGVTSSLASRYEVRNRNPGEDFRRHEVRKAGRPDGATGRAMGRALRSSASGYPRRPSVHRRARSGHRTRRGPAPLAHPPLTVPPPTPYLSLCHQPTPPGPMPGACPIF